MKKNILILGGGFAGVQAAIELQKTNNFTVTLISDRDYLFLYPTSIWIPVHQSTFEQNKILLSDIQKAYPFSLVVDAVKEIKHSENIVVTANHQFSYDYLIIAIGAEKMKPKGVEHTLSICGKPEVTLEIREKLDRLIEKGSGKIAIGFGGNPKDTSAVRGGPAFELLFNIYELLKKKNLLSQFELTFFAPMEEPGKKMGAHAVSMVNAMFKSYGIQARYGKKIQHFTSNSVVFEDNSELPADLILFIPGTAGHSVIQNSNLPVNEAGFISIDENGLVRGTTNVYASGDVAAIEGPEWRAKQGHLAEVMARYAAYNIIMTEQGKPERKSYKNHFSILCIMDTGTGAAFVYRNAKRSFVIPLPIIGHWMKKGWGTYMRLTKTGAFPRIPGM